VSSTAAIIQENLACVRQQIADAAAAVGRAPDEIRLVGVTKYVDSPTTQTLFEAGCTDLGESRPQQLCDKAETLAATPIAWHMIGHLQRNKIRRILPHVSLIHSGDSLKLIEAVDRIAAEDNIAQVRMLIEVNISGEQAKHGFSPDEVQPALDTIGNLTHIKIAGLMCMARRTGESDAAQTDFANLRELRDRLLTTCPESISLAELSMGMSGDFSAAIAEGATIIRVGSALFSGIC
jgi:pyridoxal phosphate enzyme (YggS family)